MKSPWVACPPWAAAAVIIGDQVVKHLVLANHDWLVHQSSLWNWPLALLTLAVITLAFQKSSRVSWALIAGGGASNLIDVFMHGFVVDPFIVRNFAFNLADLAIVAGSVIAIRSFLKKSSTKASNT